MSPGTRPRAGGLSGRGLAADDEATSHPHVALALSSLGPCPFPRFSQLYTSSNQQERLEADADLCRLFANEDGAREAEVLGLRPSSQRSHIVAAQPACVRRHEMILQRSDCEFAMLFAASSLQNCVDQRWHALRDEERWDLRGFLLALLADRGPRLPTFVAQALASVLVRVTKLAWSDPRHHTTVRALLQFLTVRLATDSPTTRRPQEDSRARAQASVKEKDRKRRGDERVE